MIVTSTSNQIQPATHHHAFQFRVLDVVLITTLLAILLAAIMQSQVWLFYGFAAVGFVFTEFVWKRPRISETFVTLAVIVVLLHLFPTYL